jgi:hypothetical protein
MLAGTLGVFAGAPLDGLVKPLDVMHEFFARLHIPPSCIHVFRAELLESLADDVGGFACDQLHQRLDSPGFDSLIRGGDGRSQVAPGWFQLRVPGAFASAVELPLMPQGIAEYDQPGSVTVERGVIHNNLRVLVRLSYCRQIGIGRVVHFGVQVRVQLTGQFCCFPRVGWGWRGIGGCRFANGGNNSFRYGTRGFCFGLFRRSRACMTDTYRPTFNHRWCGW